MEISLLATPNFFAKNLISSAFAAPSTGGAAILTFKAPPWSPTISLFDARGTIVTENTTALSNFVTVTAT